MNDNKIREIRRIRENPRFRHYPEYKESGVEWIGEIPEHWKVVRSKHLFGNRNQKGYEHEPLLSVTQAQGVLPRNELDYRVWNPERNIELYKLVMPSDWVISLRTFEGGIELSEVRGIVSPAYITMFPRRQIFNSYFKYLLKSVNFIAELNRITTGIRQGKNISYEDFSDIQIAFPALSEQKVIGNFLDRKTEQIDELIRIKERRIELLHEQRTALINQAVTKGLDPNVEMKPSGVEWIGEIPARWTISKVKHEFESLDNLRVPLNSETRGSMGLKVYDYYGASGIIDKVENYIFDEPLILIGEDGANLHLRSTPLAFKATGKYWVNNHAHVLRPKHGNIDYLTNMLESFDYTHYITGAAQPKLTSEHLMNITVIIPPPLEQAQIADFLNSKTQQIDELITTEQRKIELLTEYRQSLISEAVTGKIDIRNEVYSKT